MRSRVWLALIVALICVAGHAEWTDPAVDLPAFHTGPPPAAAKLPLILHGKQLTGVNFQLPWQVKVYKDAAKVSSVLYQLPTGPSGTPACEAVSKTCMALNAAPAPKKGSTPIR